MTIDSLLQHFHQISEAPGSLASLRRLILDLAVRGKLFAQVLEDEPAAAVLSRIIEKKGSDGGKEKKQRGASTAPEFAESQPPLPIGWIWAQLAELVAVLNGRAYAKHELLERGTPVLRVGNLFTSEHWYYSDLILDDDKYCEAGDLLFSWSASFGPFIWQGPRVIYHYHIWKLKSYCEKELDKRYLYWFLMHKTEAIKDAGHGISMLHMTKEKMERVSVPLPPLAEQRRIVAKVDELMSLCDHLEAARSEREATRDRLTASSIAFLSKPNSETFQSAADFALTTLAEFTKRPDQIKQLRQIVRNLAVYGKLAPQDSKDEPASELLRQIASEKSLLGIKHTALPSSNAALPFELPKGWAWTRIGEICSKTGSGSTPRGGKDVYKNSGIPFLRSQNIYNDGLRLNDVAYIDEETHLRMSGTSIKPGDLLLNITGGSIGRCCRVPSDFEQANISQHIAIVRVAVKGVEDFLHCLILSPYFQAYIFDEQTGAGRGGLPKNRMDQILVALPPLAEQHRITAKVNKLMAVCDELELQLHNQQNQREGLLQALIDSALRPSKANNVVFVDFASSRRQAVGCYAISKLADKHSFGRTAAMKVLFLAEAWLGLDLKGHYSREAAGPFDKWIYNFELEGVKNGWFTTSEKSTLDGYSKVYYEKGKHLGEKVNEAKEQLTKEQLEQFDKLLSTLANLPTEKVELTATLFAAWNDFLISNESPTDKKIVHEVRNNWHKSKQRFSELQSQECLAWMRANNLVPHGIGPATIHQRALLPD